MDRRTQTRNLLTNTLGEAAWGFSFWLIFPGTVLALVLTHYGATKTMIGAIDGVTAGAFLLPQVLGPLLFPGQKNLKRRLLLFHYWLMIPWLAVAAGILAAALGGYLPPAGVRWGLLAAWALFQGAVGLVTPAWLGWVAHLFGQSTRGLAMGVSFSVSAAAGALGALTAAWIIGQPVDPRAFPLLYLLAVVMAYLSISTFWLMRDPADEHWTDPPPPGPADVAKYFLASLRDRNFRAVLVGRALANSGVCVVPLVTTHYLSPAGGELTKQALVGLGSVSLIAMATGNLVLGLHGDQRGHRAGLIVGASLQCLAPVILLTTHGWASCAAVFAVAGLGQSAGFMSHLNMVFETCPHGNRPAHITVANLVLAPTAILFPLAAGAVVQHWGIAPMGVAWLAMSLAAVLWYVTQLREPREVQRAGQGHEVDGAQR